MGARGTLLGLVAASIALVRANAPADGPEFQLVQPELFSAPGGMPNADGVEPTKAPRPLVVKAR